MTWHVDPPLLERYTLGVVDEARAYSVEAHLLACPRCRAGVSGAVSRERLDRVWDRIQDRASSVRRGVTERALVRLGLPDHVARLLAATPSLRVSWFGAMAIALGFAVLAARTGDAGVVLFLTLAPLVPLAGVGAAYGPGLDPTYEIGLAAPMRSYRLLLTRAVAVLATSIALASLATLALPRLGWPAAAWLLPALGLSAVSLALSTYWSPRWAFGSVAFAWVGAVVGVQYLSQDPFAAFRSATQIGFLTAIALAALVMAGRRETFEMRRHT